METDSLELAVETELSEMELESETPIVDVVAVPPPSIVSH